MWLKLLWVFIVTSHCDWWSGGFEFEIYRVAEVICRRDIDPNIWGCDWHNLTFEHTSSYNKIIIHNAILYFSFTFTLYRFTLIYLSRRTWIVIDFIRCDDTYTYWVCWFVCNRRNASPETTITSLCEAPLREISNDLSVSTNRVFVRNDVYARTTRKHARTHVHVSYRHVI